jgi:hypothetical protein
MVAPMPSEKPTSAQIRLEAERLRATAIKLMEHAATLIEKSAELEKRISASQNNGNKGKKP